MSTPDTVSKKARPVQEPGGILETLKTIVYAVLIAVLVRTVVAEPFVIPSGSMIPTLLVNDYVFVSKWSYGYSRYSMPFGPHVFDGRLFFHQPARGDVIVFKLPRDPSVDYIKRCVGLPGDTIQVKAGLLYINGKPVTRERLPDFDQVIDQFNRKIPTPMYKETMPDGGKSYTILKAKSPEEHYILDDTPEYHVPQHMYFMMGDNRDNSQDSRTTEVSFVPEENLVGPAQFIWLSLDEDVHVWELWKWPTALRVSRMGTIIQ